MKKDSNLYIFIYASVLVVLVAVVLTLANLTLKERQERNVAIAKMEEILASIGISSDATTAEDLFRKNIKTEMVINKAGDVLGLYEDGVQKQGDYRAFDIKLKAELKKQSKGGEGKFPLYKAQMDGKTVYIIPVYGKGLWDDIWGNIALEEDLNTIYGANFGHKGETPGLGAEIAAPKKEGKTVFSDQFKGKTIFDEQGNFVSVACVKGGVANQNKIKPEHGVDAISGGTLTSNGVTHMLHDCLVNYIEYIKKNK